MEAFPPIAEPIDKVAAALVKAQKAFAPALKANTNPHFKSKYADLAACVEAVVEALNDAGIYLLQRTHESDTGGVSRAGLSRESLPGAWHTASADQKKDGNQSWQTIRLSHPMMLWKQCK